MTDPTKAVFLSYAREDVAAAGRIAEALRSHGIEVWFDQSELRGGDAWDQKIRRQIGECTLFLPIISHHTQERHKGYFRLEWKLAVEQTHQMAEGVAFIAPVVVDDTSESSAVVPPEFMRVQWTRLQGALPTTQFVEQIKRLLEAPQKPASATRPAFPVPTSVPVGAALAAPARAPTSGAPTRLMLIAAAVLLLAFGAWYWTTIGNRKSTIGDAAAKGDKAIAVLPFANFSSEPDSQYFADGIQDLIITQLFNLTELRVISRTSVEQFRKTTKTMPQIGRELGVSWLLEGNVQRTGGNLTVNAQLIRVGTDEAHAWAKSFTKEYTPANLFAIQSELAQSIAASLKVTITPREKQLLENRPTENAAALDLYLKQRDVANREGVTWAAAFKRESLLQSAVELDPSFLLAWHDLAWTRLVSYLNYFDTTPAFLARAKDAVDATGRIASGSPEALLTRGYYEYAGRRDYDAALALYGEVARLRPQDAVVTNRIASVQRRQGRWTESIASFRKATELEPGDTAGRRELITTFGRVRRYADAISEQRRVVAQFPGNPVEDFFLARLAFQATGSTHEVDAFLAGQTAVEAAAPLGLENRKSWARIRGDFAESVRLDRLLPYFDSTGLPHEEQAAGAALTLAAAGDLPGARARLGALPQTLRARLELDPANVRYWFWLASMEMILGNKEEAVRCGRKAVELLPEERDAMLGPSLSFGLASIYAWTGDKDRALGELTRLLRIPGVGANVHEIRSGPEFFPLHGDPRFEALLNDPKNNAPLF